MKALELLYQYQQADERYKEYKKIQNQIDGLKREQSKILKEIAESKNKALADIGTDEIIKINTGKES